MAAFCLLAKQGPLFSFCTVTCKLHSRVPTISPKTAGMIGIFLAGFWSLLGVGDTSPPFLHPHTTSLGCGQTYFSDPKPPHPQIPAWTRRLPHAPPMADGMAEPRTVAPATTADLAPSRRTSGRQLPPPLPPPPGEAATCSTFRMPAWLGASRNVSLLTSHRETTFSACPGLTQDLQTGQSPLECSGIAGGPGLSRSG